MGLRAIGIMIILLLSVILNKPVAGHSHPATMAESEEWADSVLGELTLEQKIGQLIMVSAYSNQGERHVRDLELLIRDYHVGGLIFFQGSPEKQFMMTRRLQSAAQVPLFIAMDAEWGLAMRLEEVTPLPRLMTLGAVNDERLIYNYGAEIARQCRLMGVHINFAPVLDVNNNPANPVINIRSFGENPARVGRQGTALLEGLQDNGILAVGKHFPGHGDTRTDSHYALPLIGHDRARLDSVELRPFKEAIAAGLDGIMVAHLNIPSLEPRSGWSASLSQHIISGTLRDDLGFKGLIFTDALNMKGATDLLAPGELEVEAFKAGNDILVMPVNLPAVIRAFRHAINNNAITIAELDERVRRILIHKHLFIGDQDITLLKNSYDPGNHAYPGDLVKALNINAPSLNEHIFEEAVTLVRNKNGLIPFHLIDTLSFASLSINEGASASFRDMLDAYAPFAHYSLGGRETAMSFTRLEDKLAGYNVVIVSLHELTRSARRNYGLDQPMIDLIHRLSRRTEVVLVSFGIPYSLNLFADLGTLVCGYEDQVSAARVVPQILFGALPAKGSLPVGLYGDLGEGTGHSTEIMGRLCFREPSRFGLDEGYTGLIDKVIDQAIREEAMPGCQILVARGGNVILNKAYGYQTYDSIRPVTERSVYDLASVTKVAASLQALMMLYDKGMINLDKKISVYLPELKGTNKQDMIIRDILAHQAGLYPYLPFWRKTIYPSGNRRIYFRKEASEDYSVEVTPNIYTRPSLRDSLLQWIIESELIEKEDPLKPYEYRYSDMGFYLIQELVEELSGWPLDLFLEEYVYQPLGLEALAFRPRERYTLDRIIPSGYDNHFRNDLIHGNVHDEIASIYGGVAGHAGLFSNTLELAKILQMNLQEGYYGGIRFFHPATIREFTRQQYKKNRRGLGWDKPQTIGEDYNPASYMASDASYGHSGFTGTYAWIDPEYQLIYIFLSNRAYPDPDNKKLIDQVVRKRIQTIVYSAINNQK